MILLKLFIAFLKISSFAIGGAYAFLPLIEKEVVETSNWLTKDEFLDVLGIARLFPGAISIKYATYTGYKIAGIPGAIAANCGNLFTPVVVALFVFAIYSRYKDMPAVKGALNMIHLVVFAMIIAVAFQIVDVNQLIRLRSAIVVVISFTLFVYTKIHPAVIIISAGILGAFLK